MNIVKFLTTTYFHRAPVVAASKDINLIIESLNPKKAGPDSIVIKVIKTGKIQY